MNRIYPTDEAGRAAAKGPLEFIACNHCGFTWNRAFDPALIVYDSEYENDQAYSPSFRAHMEERAEDVVGSAPEGQPISYLEVGCGQGRFLSQVVKAAGGRLRSAEGFDPAWRGKDGEGPDGSSIHRTYFDKDTASLLSHAPNVVATRHTIEHVPDPVAFLVAIREALGPSSTARLWVETPCVSWIVRNSAMQDFFYEHCSLFTAGSLAAALRRAGFASPRVRHVFGGQYLWAEAVAGEATDEDTAEPETEHPSLELARENFIRHWRAELEAARARGIVALWGAGAKGVSFSILADPERKTIDHVVDVNPGKQGFFLPGSGLRVVSPQGSAERKPQTIFVMNPNYMGEIAETAREAGIVARLVAIE
ncbi:MAG: methyltransferase domain-containing protein [Parvibaculum sp.]|uniref:class I SAM-dependent methyltransferase n=1 Tax=Parvibaculum sp. TaxID=2024848 RepID=UPI0025D0B049|nr:class I SAM-dependent methyltransferase [Parvibaculum sp.]MCE9648249.1 methyltransferase domain-containing protein [Parvibaculum sp.]